MKHRTGLGIAIAVVLATVATACGGGDKGKDGATEKDFSITLDESSVAAGSVTFDVTNEGPSTHEFVVFKTDLDPGALPTKEENGVQIVDEAGAGVTHIDEIEDIEKGTTKTLKVDLQAGHYVLLCNLPAHYQSGMHVGLTVE
jgi:uncharacterized cupredoxin-like copper-binding protein